MLMSTRCPITLRTGTSSSRGERIDSQSPHIVEHITCTVEPSAAKSQLHLPIVSHRHLLYLYLYHCKQWDNAPVLGNVLCGFGQSCVTMCDHM